MRKKKLSTTEKALEEIKQIVEEFQQKCDELLDEYEVPKELIGKWAELDVELRDYLDNIEAIENATAIVENEELMDRVFDKVESGINSDYIKRCVAIADVEGFIYIKANSLADIMLIEQFCEQHNFETNA